MDSIFRKRWLSFFLPALFIFFLAGFTSADVETSVQNLRSEDVDVRLKASNTLINMGPVAVKPLIGILEKEKEPSLRKEAVFILGAIGDPAAIKPLARALGDRNSDVRVAATWGLVKLGEPAVSPLVETLGAKDPHMVLGAETALAKIGVEAVPALIGALDHKNAHIRRSAVRVLGRIGDPGSVDALKKVQNDKNEAVRKEARASLKNITESK